MTTLPETTNDNYKPQSATRDEIERLVGVRLPELVHQAVAKEEERRFRQLKWIAAFIGVVGLGTFGTLATFMVEKVVDAKAGNIKETLELTRINGLALKLNIGKSFSPNDRDEAMALLIRISKSPTVKASQDVRSALSDVLRSFTSAGLEAEVDQLFVAFQDEVLANGLSSEILLHHYGQQIVGRTIRPTTEDFALRAFERLERGSAGHDLLELSLAYRILYESLSKADESRIKNLLTSSLDLSAKDSVRFFREILIRTKVDNWQTEPSAQGKTFERVARQFFVSYRKPLLEIYKADPDIVDGIAESGVDGDTALEVATQFVRGAAKQRTQVSRADRPSQ